MTWVDSDEVHMLLLLSPYEAKPAFGKEEPNVWLWYSKHFVGLAIRVLFAFFSSQSVHR